MCFPLYSLDEFTPLLLSHKLYFVDTSVQKVGKLGGILLQMYKAPSVQKVGNLGGLLLQHLDLLKNSML